MKTVLFFIVAALLHSVGGTAYAAPQTVRLDVPGMTCPLCPITVRKALERVDGVSKVDVSFERREAVVTFDDAMTRPQALMEATRNAGYPSTLKKGK